jgi:hypothetical protein
LNLTLHFTLEEMTISEAGARLQIDNTPGPVALANLELVAACMEKIRTLLGNRPIVVHSGYRAPGINEAVGGVATSAHCLGLACDFVCPEFGTPYEIATKIEASELEYDQLILEYGWVHVGLAREGTLCRREALTKHSSTSGYESGIRA